MYKLHLLLILPLFFNCMQVATMLSEDNQALNIFKKSKKNAAFAFATYEEFSYTELLGNSYPVELQEHFYNLEQIGNKNEVEHLKNKIWEICNANYYLVNPILQKHIDNIPSPILTNFLYQEKGEATKYLKTTAEEELKKILLPEIEKSLTTSDLVNLLGAKNIAEYNKKAKDKKISSDIKFIEPGKKLATYITFFMVKGIFDVMQNTEKSKEFF